MGIRYYRDMGTVVPDTSSFSPVTSSRHWMAGLVASGTILLFYLVANWLLGRLAAEYHPLAWWRVWALGVHPPAPVPRNVAHDVPRQSCMTCRDSASRCD